MSGAETCMPSGCGAYSCPAIWPDTPSTVLGGADVALKVGGSWSGCGSAVQDGGVRARGEDDSLESIRSSRKLLVVVAEKLVEIHLGLIVRNRKLTVWVLRYSFYQL